MDLDLAALSFQDTDVCCSDMLNSMGRQATQNSRKPFTALHALVIGIDRYANITGLTGAVADANSITEYLIGDLSVPTSQIVNLRDSGATRATIISALHALREDPNIQPLSPILIYYAGHGTEVNPPGGKGPKVQCIVPQDVKNKDNAGNPTYPIPAYTLSVLFSDLAKAKGNNITVIFDCCHSAGGTRGAGIFDKGGPHPPGTILHSRFRAMRAYWPTPDPSISSNAAQARYASLSEDLLQLPGGLDHGILSVSPTYLDSKSDLHTHAALWSSLHSDTLSQTSFRDGGRPYVLLAACGKQELAYECMTHHRGYFTSNLLHIIRNTPLEMMTYKDCVERFPKFNTPRTQSPVCEGELIGRGFFAAEGSSADPSFIWVIKERDVYFLKAGVAHGVLPGTTFSLHASDLLGSGNPSLGTFSVESDEDSPFRSRCQTGRGLDQILSALHPAFAKLVDRPNLFESSTNLLSSPAATLKHGSRSQEDHIQFELLKRDQLTLSVDNQTGDLTWEATPGPGRVFVMGVLPRALSPTEECVNHVLSSMALWNWHVSRMPERHLFLSGLQLELYRLEDCNADSFGSSYRRLQPTGDDFFRSGFADIIASSEVKYGLKITNQTNRQLYAYPFYFSTIKQSIRPLFLRVAGNEYIDPSLESGSELTVGYGNDDLGPLSFQLDERIRVDIGVFRVLVTTSPTNFEFMTQASPFSTSSNPQLPSENSKLIFGIDINPINKARPSFHKFNWQTATHLSSGANNSIKNHITGFSAKTPYMVMDDGETDPQIQPRELWDIVDAKVVIRR